VNQEIPSPEELDARKQGAHEIPEEPPQVEVVAPIDTQDTTAPDHDPALESQGGGDIDTDSLTTGEGTTVPSGSGPADSQQQVESAEPSSPPDDAKTPVQDGVSDEQAVAELQEQLGAEEENNPYVCKVCGIAVDDTDLHELTQIRYQEYLCLPHFKEKLNASK
jgi:hypothetical protein